MKPEENMKFKTKTKFLIHKKFIKISKKHSINIKNYTAHPHDLVHVPAKFRENTAMRFWVTVQKLNVTDGQTDGTDGGALQYLPSPGLRRRAGDNNKGKQFENQFFIYGPKCKKKIFGLFGGPWGGGFRLSHRAYVAFSTILSPNDN